MSRLDILQVIWNCKSSEKLIILVNLPKMDWKSPNYSKTDAYYRLNREGQTIIFCLCSGHNRLKKHMHTKLKIGTSPNCTCGNIAQTAEHILQDCPLHAELRQQTWSKPSTLDDKMNGTEYNLTQTVELIKAIGLQIWRDANIMGTQKKKKNLSNPQKIIFSFISVWMWVTH